MKIANAFVNICSPGRNFVTLKIETDEGIYGLGDATLNGRELAVASYLSDHLIPCILNRDPFQTEDIWQYLYRGAYWRRGSVTMSAIAAVDMALWDIKGKALNTPVYNLLGGRSRDAVLVYAHAHGADIEEACEDVARHIAMGYRAIRVQSGIPGLDATYGVPKGAQPYEPAERGLPSESRWSTEKYLNHVPKLFARVREQFGDDLHLLHDCHHRLSPIEAARLGKELELFTVSDVVGAGLPLWLPKGATIRRLLEEYILERERALGYQHVYTPDLAKVDLYERSGHWAHYKDSMFPPMELEHERMVLRPMNCPHHILIYESKQRSYRDLPVKIAELGTMYRYERSGALSGLSRVRCMTLTSSACRSRSRKSSPM